MSLLTATQGTPNRVFALLRFLREAGTPVSAEMLAAWFEPRNRMGGTEVVRPKEALEQTISAARSLQLASDGWPVSANLETPHTVEAFAGLAHRQLGRLPETDANALIFRVYAWFVLRAESHAAELYQTDRKVLVNEIISALPLSEEDDDAKPFNTTKFKPWARWVSFFGLGEELPNTPFFPYPVERLSRELREIGRASGFDRDIEFREVYEQLHVRMPYLDGGVTFMEMVERTGWKPRYLSRVLSAALRELHREGEIRLTALGDSAGRVQFAQDPNDISGLPGADRIRIFEEAVRAA